MTAQDIIDIIKTAGARTSKDIREVLEDGAALAALGITDADQEAVEEAHDLLRDVGRPVTIDGKRTNVMLDQPTIEAATKIGKGNLSAGLREAVRDYRAVEVFTDSTISVGHKITGYCVRQSADETKVVAWHNNGYPRPIDLGEEIKMPKLRYKLSNSEGLAEFKTDFLSVYKE